MTQNELNHLAVELLKVNDTREGFKEIARTALANNLGFGGAMEACNFAMDTHLEEQRKCK